MKYSNEKDITSIEWQYGGEPCSGMFNPMTSTAVLNFFLKSSTVTITYRVMDMNTLAVVIVEVDEGHSPTIQYGNMCRIDLDLYDNKAK